MTVSEEVSTWKLWDIAVFIPIEETGKSQPMSANQNTQQEIEHFDTFQTLLWQAQTYVCWKMSRFIPEQKWKQVVKSVQPRKITTFYILEHI